MRWAIATALGAAALAGVALQGNAAATRETALPSYPLAPVVPNGIGDTEHLQPGVQRAVDRAIAAAAADGVELRVTSGWRSRDKQQRLYEEAIAKYGSAQAARRWVLPPAESAHVRGGAVDVGPESGASWLDGHGVRFGLCRRYDNEPWHFERLAAAKGSTCPRREPHA